MRLSQFAVVTMAGLFSTTVFVTQVQAECSSNLPYEQLVDCIVVEGSGARYKPQQQHATDEKQVIETVTNDNHKAKAKTKSNAMAAAE